MATRGKRYVEARGTVDREQLYTPVEAVRLLKDAPAAKFDETIEVHMNLGLNVRHADEQLRGTLMLPHGTGREQRVAVFAEGDKARAARDREGHAGASASTQLLVRMPDVQAEVHVHLDRLVELRSRLLLEQANRFNQHVSRSTRRDCDRFPCAAISYRPPRPCSGRFRRSRASPARRRGRSDPASSSRRST